MNHPSKLRFRDLIPLRAWIVLLAGGAALAALAVYQLRPQPLVRDLMTPASRLVGHWLLYSPSDLPSAHLFYGPLDPADGNRGRAAMIDHDGGMVFEGYYRLVGQFAHGLDLTIREDLGPSLQRQVVITMARDGKAGRYRYFLLDTEQDQRLQYLDDEIVPPEGFAASLKKSKR